MELLVIPRTTEDTVDLTSAEKQTKFAGRVVSKRVRCDAYSDRIATIGCTAVARRAAGRPARIATEMAIAEAPA